MKQRVTKALIEKHLGDEVKPRCTLLVWPPWHAPGWHISLPSGASVKLTQSRIDFGIYSSVENRADIDEDKFQEEVWACLELGKEVWGGIGVYGGATQEEIAQFLNNVESAGIKTGDQGLVLRHFGPEATFRCHWRGWEVRFPDGRSVKVAGGAIEEVSGDAEIFRASLMLLHELAPDNVVVRGNSELILAGLQHGESLGITVIPEIIVTVWEG
jgi:hypothetical protein